MAWQDDQGLWRYIVEKLVTRKFGEVVCGYTLLKGKMHECICVPCENSLVKNSGDLRRELKNQVNRIICSLNKSQPLSPATLVITQKAMNKVIMVTRMEIMYGLNNLAFCSPKLIRLWPLLSVQSAIAKNNTKSEIQHSSPGRLASYLEIVLSTLDLLIMERSLLPLLK